MKIKKVSLFIMTLFMVVLLVACKQTIEPKINIEEIKIGRSTVKLVFSLEDPEQLVNPDSFEGKVYLDSTLIRTVSATKVADSDDTYEISVTSLEVKKEYKLEVVAIVNKKLKVVHTETFTTITEGSNSENPIIINSIDDFLNMEDDYSAFYKLGEDLDFSEVESYTPIFSSQAFSGNFDGDNKTIKNLTINKRSTYVGLFGRNSGTIKNLNIDNMQVNLSGTSQSSQYISILAARNTGIIKNVNITNSSIKTYFSHSGTVRIGGATAYGESSSKIIDTNVELDLDIEAISRSEFSIGALAGELNGASISGSSAKTTIKIANTTTAYIGGAVGKMTFSTTANPSVTKTEAELDININTKVGTVVSNDKTVAIYIGGFLGKAWQAKITDAYGKATIVYSTAHNIAQNQSDDDKISLGGFAGALTHGSQLENILADADISLGKTYDDVEESKVIDVKFEHGYATTEKPTVEEIFVGEEVAKPNDPTREGYEFIGWYLGNELFDFDMQIYHPINLVAGWQNTDPAAAEEKLLVIFDRGYSGLYLASRSVTKGETVTAPETPIRDGHKFLGWYLNGEEFDFETPINASLGLVAKWQKVGIDRFEYIYVGGFAGETNASDKFNKVYVRNPEINLSTDQGTYRVNSTIASNSEIIAYSSGKITIDGEDYTNKNYYLEAGKIEVTETTITALEDFFQSEYILGILAR